MTERRPEQIPVPDRSDLRLTIIEPESVVRGGIVVCHEARGVTDAVRRVADGLAIEGWLAVVPYLYHRDSPNDQSVVDEDVHCHLARLSVDSVLADVDAALCWLAGRGIATDRMGVVGFGLGGTVALLVATCRQLGAAVTVDGIGVVRPVSPALPALVEVAPELRCPWLGVYGGDDLVPEVEVDKLRDAAHSAQVATDLVHLTRGGYRGSTAQAAAVEAWTRTLNWFDSHLR
ncbi:MAG TPA: dienelactone hydrolase family protein [Pseudonocardiaceae bacterium]|jgi:carboxymethylenebutenolidase|nr:dienelactone hydrolase family protein [Pseudonocardiaceae bacterium]